MLQYKGIGKSYKNDFAIISYIFNIIKSYYNLRYFMEDIFNSWLVEEPIAHRGLHDKSHPENSLSSFS
jgi:hypothetical protein